jgi:hypothetical protein
MAGSSSTTIVRYDLAHWGTVTSIISTTVFTSTALIGFGDGELIGYGVYVLRDIGGAGASPQATSQLVSGYISATGQFTTAAFANPLKVGDEVLVIHPSLYATSPSGQIALLHGLPPVAGSVTANWHSGGVGGTVVCTIGAAGVRYKVHSAIIDISALGGNVTPIMTISVNGSVKQVFPPKAGTTFSVVAGDAAGIALINGTFGIANPLVIKAYSDGVGDDGTNINFEYFLEAM